MSTGQPRTRLGFVIGTATLVTGLALSGVGVAAASGTAAAEATFVPVEPCRLMDTRPSGVGDRSEPIGPRESHVQQVTGTVGGCAIPADAVAVSTNVTIVGPTAAGFLTLYPADAPARRPRT